MCQPKPRRFRVGFHGPTPTAPRANLEQAASTDLASVITLANELRAALVEKGVDQGLGLNPTECRRSRADRPFEDRVDGSRNVEKLVDRGGGGWGQTMTIDII